MSRHSAFPTIPVTIFALTVATTLFIFIAPPMVKARRIRKNIRLTGSAPTWFGYMFSGQCIITARLLHPLDRETAQSAAGIGSDQAGMILRVDNSRGTEKIIVTLNKVRFFTISGSSIPAMQLPADPTAGQLSVNPGDSPATTLLLFPRKDLLANIERMYALQLRVNGEIANLPGCYYPDPAAADRMQREFEMRIRLFPDPAKLKP